MLVHQLQPTEIGIPLEIYAFCKIQEVNTFEDIQASIIEYLLAVIHVSMDAPLVQDEDNTMYDVLKAEDVTTPETALLYDSLKKEIERAISTLTQREADVVRLFFGLNGSHPQTLDEIGEKFGLTRERVRQIKEKAIRRLKHTSRSRNLKTYLG